MTTLTLRQVEGFKPEGSFFPYLRGCDPYNRTVFLDRGTEYGLRSWDQIKDHYGIEIVLTPEELEMVERGRWSLKVKEAAEVLKFTIDKWLQQENRR